MRNGAGWLEGLTINSTEPQPSNEVMRDGRIVLGFDSLNAGERLTFWTQYQVNPTTVAHRDQGVELDDGAGLAGALRPDHARDGKLSFITR